jgi:shikimate dehydrogenase
MKKLYLLGHPVSHSLSPIMQNEALKSLGLEDKWRYEALNVPPEELIAKLEELEADTEVIGCNITVPHKVAVHNWLKSANRHLSRDSDYGEVVNSLVRRPDGQFGGDTTDFQGAKLALKQEAGIEDFTQFDVAVLGTGGSAQSIIAGFDFDHEVRSVKPFSRNPGRTSKISEETKYEIEIWALSDFPAWSASHPASIVVQATTVGMETGNNPEQSPVPSGSVKDGQIAFDLVYKPHNTRFLLEAKAHGATLVHGINMLVGQGALSLQQWIEASAEPSVRESFDLFETMATMRTALGV